jgi:hypothetical protein
MTKRKSGKFKNKEPTKTKRKRDKFKSRGPSKLYWEEESPEEEGSDYESPMSDREIHFKVHSKNSVNIQIE